MCRRNRVLAIKAFPYGVERAGSDIAVDDAQRADSQREQVFGTGWALFHANWNGATVNAAGRGCPSGPFPKLQPAGGMHLSESSSFLRKFSERFGARASAR